MNIKIKLRKNNRLCRLGAIALVLVGPIFFIALRKKWSWKVRGTCLGLIAAYFTFGMFVPVYNAKTEKAKERIGYVFESGFGSKGHGSGRTPWSNIGSGDSGWKTNYCPPRENHTDMRWILSVLHNIHYE
ncbi:hypothetical protein FACS189497_14730 [Betaproteobacteria bacterium]|nr:hypothetical protein FACS189488_14370 [Betaproteobacteria bacterium]GHU33013.1 hypothetical protein FACS189497_14730 [Betaproteobacteria bacterium]